MQTGELTKIVLAEGLDGSFNPIDIIGDTLYITVSARRKAALLQSI